MTIFETDKKQQRKRRGQGGTNEKHAIEEKQWLKVWPSWSDEVDFCHREKYKQFIGMVRLRYDNNEHNNKAYNKDEQGRHKTTTNEIIQ